LYDCPYFCRTFEHHYAAIVCVRFVRMAHLFDYRCWRKIFAWCAFGRGDHVQTQATMYSTEYFRRLSLGVRGEYDEPRRNTNGEMHLILYHVYLLASPLASNRFLLEKSRCLRETITEALHINVKDSRRIRIRKSLARDHARDRGRQDERSGRSKTRKVIRRRTRERCTQYYHSLSPDLCHK